jgi:hypothetical protein
MMPAANSALALHGLVHQAGVDLGARRVGLGLAELGRGQVGQHAAGLHALADVGVDAGHAAGKGRVDALGVFLVPDQAGRQFDHDVGGRPGRLRGQQGQLRVAGRKAQLLALHDGGGGLRRPAGPRGRRH